MRANARVLKTALAACSLAFGVLVSSGCGQKGPLFLPDQKPPAVEPPAPQPGTEPASEDAKKKEEPR